MLSISDFICFSLIVFKTVIFLDLNRLSCFSYFSFWKLFKRFPLSEKPLCFFVVNSLSHFWKPLIWFLSNTVLLFLECHKLNHTVCSLWFWLLSLSIMLFRFIHVIAWVSSLFLFFSPWDSPSLNTNGISNLPVQTQNWFDQSWQSYLP